jgi:hypothetical protein
LFLLCNNRETGNDGKPVNISNIEKKGEEEFENVSDKFKNVDYDKYGNQIKRELENRKYVW